MAQQDAATQEALPDVELPADLAEAFRRAGRLDDPPETLAEGFRAVTALLNEVGTVTLEDMYQPEPTRHRVHTPGGAEHVPCVLDALIVALLLETDPVDIDSEPPAGEEPVHIRVTGDEVTVTPERAVASFGLGLEESADPGLDALDEALNDPDAPIPTTCSAINAFPTSAAFDRWERGVSEAAVMELSVEELFALARWATEAHVAG